MNSAQRQILIRQIDKKISTFTEASKYPIPGKGWISAVRNALNMTLKQLSGRLNMTPQGIKDIERREADGSITLQKLREVAAAMDMQLVYGLVPKEETLEKMIEKKARDLAKEIVLKTAHTMQLENQALDEATIASAIDSRAYKIKLEIPKTLWN